MEGRKKSPNDSIAAPIQTSLKVKRNDKLWNHSRPLKDYGIADGLYLEFADFHKIRLKNIS